MLIRIRIPKEAAPKKGPCLYHPSALILPYIYCFTGCPKIHTPINIGITYNIYNRYDMICIILKNTG